MRDTLLGRPSADVDLASERPDAFVRCLEEAGARRAVLLDPQRRTWRVVLAEGRFVDVAAWKGPTLEQDLRARDFTINALAWTPARGLLDPLGGRADLSGRRLRLAADDAIEQDPLRALRAVRLAAVLDFELDDALLGILGTTSLANIKAERIKAELEAMLTSDRAARALRLLERCSLLDQVLPATNVERFARVIAWPCTSPALRRCRRHVAGEAGGELALRLGWLLEPLEPEALAARRWPLKVVRRAVTVATASAGEGDADRADALMAWACGAAFALLGLAARRPSEAEAEQAGAPVLALLDAAVGGRNPKELGVPPLPKALLTSREVARRVGGPGPAVGVAARGLMRAQLLGDVVDVDSARRWLEANR